MNKKGDVELETVIIAVLVAIGIIVILGLILMWVGWIPSLFELIPFFK